MEENRFKIVFDQLEKLKTETAHGDMISVSNLFEVCTSDTLLKSEGIAELVRLVSETREQTPYLFTSA